METVSVKNTCELCQKGERNNKGPGKGNMKSEEFFFFLVGIYEAEFQVDENDPLEKE